MDDTTKQELDQAIDKLNLNRFNNKGKIVYVKDFLDDVRDVQVSLAEVEKALREKGYIK